jgi:beta-glucosidase
METLFLWPGERVIRASGMQGVMSSYNDYDGVPISGSKEFLTTILRQRFGFRGYVVSDSDAVEYLTSKHHVAADYKEACRQYLEAGGNVRTEFNSPSKFILPVRELVKEGKLSQAVLNDRVGDVLRVKFELGLFDRPLVADPAASDAMVHCAAHAEVAKQAARESLVLLKNSNRILYYRGAIFVTPLPKQRNSLLFGINLKETNTTYFATTTWTRAARATSCKNGACKPLTTVL